MSRRHGLALPLKKSSRAKFTEVDEEKRLARWVRKKRERSREEWELAQRLEEGGES